MEEQATYNRKFKYDVVIGIDPDVERSGLAILGLYDMKLTVNSHPFPELLEIRPFGGIRRCGTRPCHRGVCRGRLEKQIQLALVTERHTGERSQERRACRSQPRDRSQDSRNAEALRNTSHGAIPIAQVLARERRQDHP